MAWIRYLLWDSYFEGRRPLTYCWYHIICICDGIYQKVTNCRFFPRRPYWNGSEDLQNKTPQHFLLATYLQKMPKKNSNETFDAARWLNVWLVKRIKTNSDKLTKLSAVYCFRATKEGVVTLRMFVIRCVFTQIFKLKSRLSLQNETTKKKKTLLLKFPNEDARVKNPKAGVCLLV